MRKDSTKRAQKAEASSFIESSPFVSKVEGKGGGSSMAEHGCGCDCGVLLRWRWRWRHGGEREAEVSQPHD